MRDSHFTRYTEHIFLLAEKIHQPSLGCTVGGGSVLKSINLRVDPEQMSFVSEM